jgi:hypothetical protein
MTRMDNFNRQTNEPGGGDDETIIKDTEVP